MKQHVSLLMIAARSTIYKIAGLLLLMTVVQAALFWRLLRRATVGELYPLENLIRASGVSLVCAAAFLLLCVILSKVGSEFSGSRARYTILRLSVREGMTVLLWAVYNMICFFIFWAVQLAVALLLCLLYTRIMDPMYINDQTVFTAFYRSGFLHSLLPLDETTRYIRNIALILALGLAAAFTPHRQRRGQKGFAFVFFSFCTVAAFAQGTGNLLSDMMIILAALLIAAYYLHEVFRGEVYDE